MRKLGIRSQSKKLNNKGLTLVEVMVSITVFGLMVGPIITQFNSILKQNYTVKLSQAETDYATRVMEEFKSPNSDAMTIPLDDDGDEIWKGDGTAETKAKYIVRKVDVDGDDTLKKTFTKEGIRIEEDLDPDEKSLVKSDTSYKVKVTTDASVYDKDSNDDASYQNPNITKLYDLENIDRRFSVIVSDGSANYDNRAASDLLDKMASKLKETSPKRYNLWLTGVDVFNRVEYDKNTYIKMRYDATKKKYYATVVLNYSTTSDAQATADVSYTLVNDKEFDAKALNYKAPSVYIFYNQFVQNNLVISGTVRESITIDNSGMDTAKASAAAFDCYLVKAETDVPGTYTYYKRLETAGDEKVGSIETENTVGSLVYNVDNKFFLWPTYTIDEEYYKANKDTIDKDLGETAPTMSVFDSETKNVYVYNNALVPVSYPNANPMTVGGYESAEGTGYYSYVCKNETNMTGKMDTEEGKKQNVTQKISEGDIVYQRAVGEYVLPGGAIASKMPNGWEDNFTLCRPTKLDYNDAAKLNIVVTKDSKLAIGGRKAIHIYTNMITKKAGVDAYDVSRLTSAPNRVYNTLDVPTMGVDSTITLDPQAIKYAYPHSDDDDADEIIYPLENKVDEGRNRMYHIKLELFRVEPGNPDGRKVLTLESGKEG